MTDQAPQAAGPQDEAPKAAPAAAPEAITGDVAGEATAANASNENTGNVTEPAKKTRFGLWLAGTSVLLTGAAAIFALGGDKPQPTPTNTNNNTTITAPATPTPAPVVAAPAAPTVSAAAVTAALREAEFDRAVAQIQTIYTNGDVRLGEQFSFTLPATSITVQNTQVAVAAQNYVGKVSVLRQNGEECGVDIDVFTKSPSGPGADNASRYVGMARIALTPR